MFEFFDHTADLGLRLAAADLNGLFAEAGRGFCAMVVDNPQDVRPLTEAAIEVDGSEKEYLLFDWLNELLYRFEAERLLLSEFHVEITEQGLSAVCRGEEIDPDRHRLAHEVKAITYHHLSVEQTADGWHAEVIVDI
ncbi:MAG: archease [Planctomycetaceae bacterium]